MHCVGRVCGVWYECVCVCKYARVSTYAVCVHVRTALGIIFRNDTPSFGTGPLTGLVLDASATSAGQRDPGILKSPAHQPWGYRCAPPIHTRPASSVGAGIWTQIFTLTRHRPCRCFLLELIHASSERRLLRGGEERADAGDPSLVTYRLDLSSSRTGLRSLAPGPLYQDGGLQEYSRTNHPLSSNPRELGLGEETTLTEQPQFLPSASVSPPIHKHNNIQQNPATSLREVRGGSGWD